MPVLFRIADWCLHQLVEALPRKRQRTAWMAIAGIMRRRAEDLRPRKRTQGRPRPTAEEALAILAPLIVGRTMEQAAKQAGVSTFKVGDVMYCVERGRD